jgi:hypothetical protein
MAMDTMIFKNMLTAVWKGLCLAFPERTALRNLKNMTTR